MRDLRIARLTIKRRRPCCRFQLCIRGRTHIFKYLERQAAKHERARGGRTRRTPLDARGHATLDTRSHRRHNVDSGYSTSDGVDKRWSQEIHSAVSFTVALLALPLSLHLLLSLYNHLVAKLSGASAAEPPADLWPAGRKWRHVRIESRGAGTLPWMSIADTNERIVRIIVRSKRGKLALLAFPSLSRNAAIEWATAFA